MVRGSASRRLPVVPAGWPALAPGYCRMQRNPPWARQDSLSEPLLQRVALSGMLPSVPVAWPAESKARHLLAMKAWVRQPAKRPG